MICLHCSFTRRAESAAAKAASWASVRQLAGPWLTIEAEFRALLVDQPKCTCGEPTDPKWVYAGLKKEP